MNRHLLSVGLACSFAAVAFVGCDDPAPAPSSSPAVAIAVGAHGYEPSKVDAKAGEPLTLEFTRTTEAGCGHELVIPSQDIRRELPLDEAVAVTFTPTEAGELRFTCGMDMYEGAVVVQ